MFGKKIDRPERLEFSIGLLSCRHSDEIERYMTNPFTGEKIAVHKDPGLSDDERNGTTEFLCSCGARSEEPGEYFLDYEDGSDICVRTGPLDGPFPITGAEIDIVCKQLRDEFLDFVLHFAKVANMALIATVRRESGEFAHSIRVMSVQAKQMVQERWPNAVVMDSKSQLHEWLVSVVGSRPVY